MPNLSLFDCNKPSTHTPVIKRIVLKTIEARYSKQTVCEDAPEWVSTRFTAPAQIFEMFRNLMYETKEHFITLHLDCKNRIVCMDPVSIGSLNQSIVHPREVFKTALLSNAAAIICIHQHPTGDPNPSPEDISITKRLKEAGDIMGIRVLDHIIVGDNEYVSFAEKGLM